MCRYCQVPESEIPAAASITKTSAAVASVRAIASTDVRRASCLPFFINPVYDITPGMNTLE
jgi:hypothetical protein